ncbi:MAG TPA: hypothetical protein PK668_08580 [Myxococcota bacterium]|nr:hypothetical protein [Myxococcota bacterium]HRY92967.1 hypothetical protein [Myxococcota bacterium]HSA22072.1 hypothetical protein [Myxococcota bacterium]
MSKTWSFAGLVAVLTLGALGAGCTTKTYTLKPEEARRVAEALQSQEEVEAVAVDEEDGLVRIRLTAGDTLRLQAPGGSVAFEVPAAQAAQALPPGAFLSVEQSNAGSVRLASGLLMLATGYGLSFLGAAQTGDWVGVVPLAGPVYTMASGASGSLLCGLGEDPHSRCEKSYGTVFASVASLAMQSAGLALTIAGAVEGGWDREVYRAPGQVRPGEGQGTGEGGLGVTVSFEPVVSPDGAVGGVLTGRF